MTKKLQSLREHWAEVANTEPERLDAQAQEWFLQHAASREKEQFRLAVMIAEARRAASDLRAMRAARMRLTYSQRY